MRKSKEIQAERGDREEPLTVRTRESKLRNQTFLQRRHRDGQEAHKKMFDITIREMKIKTTMRHYLTPIITANIKKNYKQ